MRGLGTHRTICNVRTPSPQPSPLWGEGALCASCCVLPPQAPLFSRRVSASEFSLARDRECFARQQNTVTGSAKPVRSKERAGVGPAFRSSVTPASPDQAFKKQINEGSGTPANADPYPPHLAMRLALFRARSFVGVPPRLSPKGIIPSQRLSFRPGFLGRGLYGRYPPSPVPVQGCTSHPGRNAGRHDAQAAREQAANPPAGTALAPMTRCASAPCDVTVMRTNVKSLSPWK